MFPVVVGICSAEGEGDEFHVDRGGVIKEEVLDSSSERKEV